jgi:O-antigen/teichoic acid export membrane protein
MIAIALTPGRILRAGSWTIASYAFTQATRLGTSLIVTRLLAPELFGIMAVATVALTGLALLSDLGVLQCIVRSPRGADARFLDTLWLVQIVRGGAIWAAALALSTGLAAAQALGWIGADSVYGDPQLPWVIAAVAFSAVLTGLESTKVAVLRRELSLAQLSKLEIVCNIASVAAVVGWALADASIRALVGGWLVGAALRTVLTHTALPGHANRLQWDASAFRELVGFGRWVLLSSSLGFFAMNGDRLILGALVSPRELGLYSIAFLMLGAARQGLSLLAVAVAYPALSEVQRSAPARLPAAYYRARLPIDLCSLALAGFLFAAGDGLIRLLYDARYADAGGMLAALSLALVFTRYEVAEQAFLALGKPRLLALINAFRLAALYALVPGGYALGGLHGAIWGIVAAAAVPVVPTLLLAARHGLVSTARELWHLAALPAGLALGAAAQRLLGG